MSRKRLAPARWVLPAVVDPPDRVCFKIEVPNDRQHIAAFLGAIYDLAKPYKWENDDAHTAIAVGRVWFGIFEALRRNNCDCPTSGTGGDDMPRLRQNPDNPCLLEQECLPDQWVTLFDASLCLQANPGQPGPGGSGPGPGETQQFCLHLNANGQVLLPIAVQGDWTLELLQKQGGWTDGGGNWFCPNGQSYTLGLCTGGGGFTGGDPLPTALHMSIVAQINTVYYDGNAIITVPSGLTDQQVVFQANDASLSDNFGDISFCVKVTANVAPPYAISYDLGSGLGAVTENQVFTVTSAAYLGGYNAQFHVTPCAKLTVVGTTGWTCPTFAGAGDVIWNQIDCAAVSHINHIAGGDCDLLHYANLETSEIGLNSDTPFTIQVRLNHI